MTVDFNTWIPYLARHLLTNEIEVRWRPGCIVQCAGFLSGPAIHNDAVRTLERRGLAVVIGKTSSPEAFDRYGRPAPYSEDGLLWVPTEKGVEMSEIYRVQKALINMP